MKQTPILESVYDYLTGLYIVVEIISSNDVESYNVIETLDKVVINDNIIISYITDKKPYIHKINYLDTISLTEYINLVKKYHNNNFINNK